MTTLLYNRIQHLSTKKDKIFGSFGEVLTYIMVSRKVNQSRIADLTQKDKKQISEYVNNHTTPYKSTQIEMADSLGVVMDHLDDGRIRIFDEQAQDRPSVEQKIQEYKARKESKGFSDTERDLLLSVLLDDAESLAANLRRLIEMENRDD